MIMLALDKVYMLRGVFDFPKILINEVGSAVCVTLAYIKLGNLPDYPFVSFAAPYILK